MAEHVQHPNMEAPRRHKEHVRLRGRQLGRKLGVAICRKGSNMITRTQRIPLQCVLFACDANGCITNKSMKWTQGASFEKLCSDRMPKYITESNGSLGWSSTSSQNDVATMIKERDGIAQAQSKFSIESTEDSHYKSIGAEVITSWNGEACRSNAKQQQFARQCLLRRGVDAFDFGQVVAGQYVDIIDTGDRLGQSVPLQQGTHSQQKLAANCHPQTPR